MDLLLFGLQGSGKGTQAKKLAAEFGYDLFEAGAELRKIAASGSELGAMVKSYVDEGHLVPYDIIMEVVKRAILERPKDRPILFDGIPRDADQMTSFNDIMQFAERDFRAVELTIDRDAAIQRILGRAKTEGRADDASEESVRRRMALFDEKTRPVIDAYAAAGKVTTIDGDRPADAVYEDLKHAVRE